MKAISFSSPDLAKFCPAEFNIRKGCNTVRLGTLFNYRTEEDEKLRDEGEGTFSYSIEFPVPTRVSPDWISEFEVEDGGDFSVGYLEIREEGVLVKDVSLSGSSHNCWIYCLSKSTEYAGNITDTHQDKWLLPLDKLQPFANYLGALLWSDLKCADLPDYIASQFSLQEIHQRLSLKIQVKEVEYIQRVLVIEKEEDLPVDQISLLRDRIPFMKPVKFAGENEVRIAFWLMFDDKKISIKNNNKILGLRAIDKLI